MAFPGRFAIFGSFAAVAGVVLVACAAKYSAGPAESREPDAEAGPDLDAVATESNDAAADAADAADATPSFCAQFDGGALCADFDNPGSPFGLAFAPFISGVGSASKVVGPEAMHLSRSLATTAIFGSVDTQANEAVAQVQNVLCAANGMHVEADFAFNSGAGVYGNILEISAYGPSETPLFGVYVTYSASLGLQIVDNESQPEGPAAPLAGAFSTSWAHIVIEITPNSGATAGGSVVTAGVTMAGVALAKFAYPIAKASCTSMNVGFGSYPSMAQASGAFSVNVDNVLVRPL